MSRSPTGILPTLAVIDGEWLYLSTEPAEPRPLRLQPREPDVRPSLKALCEACALRGVSQMWIMRIDPAAWDYERDSFGGWDLRPAAPAPWIHAVKAHSPYQVDIVFPALMVDGRRDGIETREECWHAAPDAATLLNALMTFRAVLGGQQWHRSGGATAARLLRRLHRGPRCLPLELPYAEVDAWPAPTQTMNTEAPIAWYRPLRANESTSGNWYLHRYDRNGAYLGALGHVRWGSGEAKHVMGPPAREDTHGAGYALIELGGDTTGRIPALTPQGRTPPAGWRGWVSMPTLRYMQERGELVTVWEHYTWEHSHKPAEPLYKLLGAARETLMHAAPDDAASALALRAVKGMYQSFCGGYMASTKWDREGDTLYRPDVRHAIVATARVNHVRRAEWVLATHGIAPVALGGVDSIYYALPDPYPVRAAGRHIEALRIGETLRDFKAVGTTRITPELCALLGSGSAPAGSVITEINRLCREGVRGYEHDPW